MRSIFLKAIICLIVAGLAFAPMFEAAYANVSQNCPCCCKAKCHGVDKCHTAAKVCLCSHQAAQVYLSKGVVLLKPDLAGYLPQNLRITYNYLSTKGIFHPPNLA